MPAQQEGSADTTRARRTKAADLAQRGLLGRAIRLLEEGIPEARGPLERAAIHNSMSVLLLDRGYLNEALAHQRKALAGYREAGSPREMLALGNKAAILTRLRRYDAALAFLEQAEQVDPRAAARPAFRASLLANRAHALHALGRLPEAQACSEEALSLREHAPGGAQARVLCTLAPVVAHTSPQRAYAQARQGLAHAVALESPAAQAFAHFVLGGLAPDRAQRRRHLVQALRLCGNDQLLRTDVISALGQSQDSGFVDAPMSAALEADLEIHEVLRHGQRNTEVHKRMVQTLCHDLRNPLTAMVMSTHAVEAEDPEDVDELLSLVRDQCAAITELLAQLEDTALAMDGQLVTGIGRVDSAVALAAALRRVQPAAQAKDIALTLQGPSVGVLADKALLARILDNLLSNAVKFSPPGSRVVLQAVPGPQECAMQVCDQGPGLSAADLDSIFEPFGKGSARPSAGEPSTGMGLFLASELARAMGGSLGAHGGQGATFELRLPRAEVASLAEDGP